VDAAAQALRHLLEHLVARRMHEGVVERLEVVHVHEEQRIGAGTLCAVVERPLQPVRRFSSKVDVAKK
jgi:hypothetical protein